MNIGVNDPCVKGPGPEDHALHRNLELPGAWKKRPIILYDDFTHTTLLPFTAATGSATAGGDAHTHKISSSTTGDMAHWIGTNAGTNSLLQLGSDNPGGVLTIKAGDEVDSNANAQKGHQMFQLGTGPQTTTDPKPATPLWFETSFSLQIASKLGVSFGLHSGYDHTKWDNGAASGAGPTSAGGHVTDGVYFWCDPADTGTAGTNRLYFITAENGTNGRSSTTRTVTDTGYDLKADTSDVFAFAYDPVTSDGTGSTVKAYINGNLVATHTTTIPDENSDGMGPYFEVGTRVSGVSDNGTMRLHYVYIRQEREPNTGRSPRA